MEFFDDAAFWLSRVAGALVAGALLFGTVSRRSRWDAMMSVWFWRPAHFTRARVTRDPGVVRVRHADSKGAPATRRAVLPARDEHELWRDVAHAASCAVSSQAVQDRQPLMRSLQVLGEQVQILHRGRDFRVAEDDRQPHHVATVAQVLRCERVAQQVEPGLR